MTIAGFCYIDPSSQKQKYLPQAQVEVHTTILSTTLRSTLTQTFLGSSDIIPELRYSFPLYDGVSVVGFTCTIGERVIKGVVKEKHQARQVYKEAVAHGQTAGLLEQLPSASDIFTTTIGNIPANAEIKVEVVYLGELKHDAQIDGIRLTIPTSIAPRYGAFPGELATHAPTSGSIKIIVDAEVPNGSHITSIQSPSHHLAVTLGRLSSTTESEPSFQRASATLSLGSAELDQDFILQIKATNIGSPSAVLEEHPAIPNQRALMATLVPKFQLPPEKPEIVFICDRSGSMGGKKIENLKTALRLLVKSLRVGMKYNICSFGSNHSFLWDRSRTYDESSLDEAMAHIETFNAKFGGTHMYRPVEDTFKRRYTDMNLEVFLLTDGMVWDQDQLIKMIGEYVSSSNGAIRLFSLGIGKDASHSLVESVAQAGNGFSQSVGDEEEMGSKVVRMLKGATFPHITDYTLDVKYANAPQDDLAEEFEVIDSVSEGLAAKSPAPSTSTMSADVPRPSISLYDTAIDQDVEMKDANKEDRYSALPDLNPPNVLQAPHQIPPLFPFNRTTIYLLISSPNNLIPKSVVLRGVSTHGPLELEIPITVLEKKGETIHQLAAKKGIGELERGKGWVYHAKTTDGTNKLLKEEYDGKFQDMVEREAVRLGVQYQVGGKWCSFVAIDTESENSQQNLESYHTSQPSTTNSQSVSQPGTSAHVLPSFMGRKVLPPGEVMTQRSATQAQMARPLGYFMKSSIAPRGAVPSGTLFGRNTTALQSVSSTSPAQEQNFGRVKDAQLAAPIAQVDENLLAQYRKEMDSACAMPLPSEDGDLSDSPELTKSHPDATLAAAIGAAGTYDRFRGPAFRRSSQRLLSKELASTKGKKKQANLANDNTVRGKGPSDNNLPTDKLHALVILQNFEGFWAWTQNLSDLMGWDEGTIKTVVDEAQGFGGLRADIAATACVVAWLQKEKSDEKDTWELLAEKAVGWLEDMTTRADELIGLAKAIV